MTTEKLEDMFRRADFTAGSSFKEDLRNRLFASKPKQKATILPMFESLSDEELGLVNAAGSPDLPRTVKPQGQ